jgi:uncharacterized LabA/DUF88 family protein
MFDCWIVAVKTITEEAQTMTTHKTPHTALRKTASPCYKVLVLVDEANLIGAAKSFNRKLDWLKLRDYLANPQEGRELLEFVVYVGLPPDMDDYRDKRSKKLKFVHWLRTQGFLVVPKDGSPSGNGTFKANVDVLMAIDGMALAAEMCPDIVVLVTGDSDFSYLARTLRRRGIRVEVAATRQTLGNELQASASAIIDLTPLFNEFDALHGEPDAIGDESVMD